MGYRAVVSWQTVKVSSVPGSLLEATSGTISVIDCSSSSSTIWAMQDCLGAQIKYLQGALVLGRSEVVRDGFTRP